jgi:hypothetical protein
VRFRYLLLAALAVLAACSNCNAAACKGGITFLVADVAGALARPASGPLQICFDGQCKSVTVTRSDAGGSVFLAFSGVGRSGDHTISVKGVGSMKGDYKGPIDSYNTPASCAGTCALASVKIGADGMITPGRVTPTTTTISTPGTGG